MSARKMTREEVESVLAVTPKEKHARSICALVGHTRMVDACFGYVHCGRCEAQVGDALLGAFDGRAAVVKGHACETCRKNAAELSWEDRLGMPDPEEWLTAKD